MTDMTNAELDAQLEMIAAFRAELLEQRALLNEVVEFCREMRVATDQLKSAFSEENIMNLMGGFLGGGSMDMSIVLGGK